MASNIVSSFKAFTESFKVPDEKGGRADALKKYFARGGVVSAVKKSNNVWPKLIYPSPLRVKSQLKELQDLKDYFAKKRSEWDKRLKDAKSYHSRQHVLKFSEPLYWKHVAKTLTDSDYRSDFEKVKLPVHLVADLKWKPMVRMFVEDLDYRKNLTETVQESIVYKKGRSKIAKYADDLMQLRGEISTSKIGELDKKIAKLSDEISALKVIEKWAAE